MNSESPQLWSEIFKIVELGIIPVIGYVAKKLAEISKELTELRTALIGIDGKNGIRSRLFHLERKVENFMERKPDNYSRYTDSQR